MLSLTTALTVAAPLAVPAVAVADLVRGRRHVPTARLYLFGLQYALNDSLEILVAPFLRLVPGLAQRIQLWSIRLLRRRADQLLGMKLAIDGLDQISPGPVIIVARHVSLFDASLPALVGDDAGLDVRGVIMAELLADPGFDLIYPHLGSVFIPRDDGPEAIRRISGMVGRVTAPDRTAIAIFPEGRLYRPSVAARLLTRLGEQDPERAQRLTGLQQSLPPRPGGLWTLLQAWPEADIAVLEHAGLDAVASLRDLREQVPLSRPVSVNVRRVERASIPDDQVTFVGWLDELWLGLDASASSRQSG